MENKKGFSILKFFVILACIIFIALSLCVNILFNKNNIPNILGYYVYVLNNQDMGVLLPEETAIIAKDAKNLNINQGDIVLCHLQNSENILIRTIYKKGTDEVTGSENYYLSTANAQDDNSVTDAIPKENIVALCTGYPQNISLGRWINFTLNIKGIALQLILPSVLLVIFLIAKIASSKDSDEDDVFGNEFEEDEPKPSDEKSKEIKESPLFVDPTPEDYTTNELERKKQSIAEHFSHKEVNPNSPYQKEKERTMQFKALKAAEKAPEATPKTKSTTKEQFDVTGMFAAQRQNNPTINNNNNNNNDNSLMAAAIREEMQKRTAEAEEKAKRETAKKISAPERTVQAPKAPDSNMTKKPSRYSDIDELINKSNSTARKKDISSASVDDLLQMIENQKKKL